MLRARVVLRTFLSQAFSILMNRKKRLTQHAEEESPPGVDISSLVDVCFLLLIFFLITSTIFPKEQDLDMNLPSEGQGSLPEYPPLVVQLKKDGEIILDPKHFPEVIEPSGGSSQLPSLAKRLRLLKAGQGDSANVMLGVAEDSDYQRFIDVINCLAGEKIKCLTLVDL